MGGSESHSMPLQPLATLVDIGLPGARPLEDQLLSRVTDFGSAWLPLAPATKAADAVLMDWKVDNLGRCGTASLLRRLGVAEAGEAFQRRAAAAAIAAEEAARAAGDWRRARFFYKDRVYCFAEYAITCRTPSGALQRQGELLKENSFLGEGTRAGRSGLLHGSTLPINELVDRTLCAEFQALSEICDIVAGAGPTHAAARHMVTGHVFLWTTGSSCLSCVGAMRQFLHLFPSVALEVHCGSRTELAFGAQRE